MSKEDGGCAFPYTDSSVNVDEQQKTEHYGSAGMSMRDYFAAKAMQGALANPQCMPLGMAFGTNNTERAIARLAYAVADAMLEKRK